MMAGGISFHPNAQTDIVPQVAWVVTIFSPLIFRPGGHIL
jgi:hypothetical protein